MEIYADNAATTKLSRSALDAMLPYFDSFYGNPSSLHSFGQKAADAVYHARTAIAKILACSPKEIIFTSGGSEADNQALVSAAYAGAKKGSRHIISSSIEHHAVLHTLDMLAKQGFEVTLLDPDPDGIVFPDRIAQEIRPDTCLVSIMYANNEIGTIQPVREIGSICREKGVLFHTDAVQAAGHLPVNVKEDHIDMLSLSAHKFGGPKGIGVLYARNGIPLTNIIYGGAQERGKRAGTENVPAIVGMAAALNDAVTNMKSNSDKILPLRERLIDGLARIPHSILNGDRSHRLPGNVNFCFEGIDSESLLLMLDRNGIAASAGSACAAGSLEPSHVLLAIGRSYELALSSLRLSINEEITVEQIDFIVQTVTDSVEKIREISPVWQDLVSGRKPFTI